MRDTKFKPEKRNNMSDTGKGRSGGNFFAGEVALEIGPKGWVGFQPTAFTGRGNSMSKELRPNKFTVPFRIVKGKIMTLNVKENLVPLGGTPPAAETLELY